MFLIIFQETTDVFIKICSLLSCFLLHGKFLQYAYCFMELVKKSILIKI